MAGAGYRSFSPNTVLKADQVQNSSSTDTKIEIDLGE